jgi:hypothetical protein
MIAAPAGIRYMPLGGRGLAASAFPLRLPLSDRIRDFPGPVVFEPFHGASKDYGRQRFPVSGKAPGPSPPTHGAPPGHCNQLVPKRETVRI